MTGRLVAPRSEAAEILDEFPAAVTGTSWLPSTSWYRQSDWSGPKAGEACTTG